MLVLALLLAAALQDRRELPAPDDDGTATIGQRACESSADAITVCGNADPSRFRLGERGDRYAEKPVRAKFTTPAGGRGTAQMINRNVGATPAPGVAITVTFPLGRDRKSKPRE